MTLQALRMNSNLRASLFVEQYSSILLNNFIKHGLKVGTGNPKTCSYTGFTLHKMTSNNKQFTVHLDIKRAIEARKAFNKKSLPPSDEFLWFLEGKILGVKNMSCNNMEQILSILVKRYFYQNLRLLWSLETRRVTRIMKAVIVLLCVYSTWTPTLRLRYLEV